LIFDKDTPVQQEVDAPPPAVQSPFHPLLTYRLLAVMDGGGELECECLFTVSHDTKTVVKQMKKK
jgi:hypothetical protein